MTPQQAKQLIDELTAKITQFNNEYYEQGESSIDDNEYDLLLKQLSELEDRFPEFRSPDSPTLRVGGSPTEHFKNVRHKHAMLSLSNLYNEQDLANWVKGIQNRLDHQEFAVDCEVKIDGFAISIIYINGVFSQAITRGNGEVGDDVTPNVKTIRNLPLTLNKPVSLDLRGEIFLSKERFSILNQQKSKSGAPTFKNPRNAAAGSIRLKNPKKVAQRGLDILIYDVVEGRISHFHSENLDYLETLGLPVNPHRKLCKSAEEVLDFCTEWQQKKDSLTFEIDGVVIKLEDIGQRDQLGYTAKSPRWATAWKFKAETATSRLLSVENSIGRTGTLTPVANLEPFELLGTEVKRATLHNYDQIHRLGIHLGDTVFVEKGGDIIPKIVGVDYTQRPENATALNPPKNCPVCGSLLVKESQEVDLRCVNATCPAILQGTLEHFVSKKGMDIQYLGGANIKLFISKGLIEDLVDIFNLSEHRHQLLALEGFGEKSVNNLLKAIETSKTVPMNQFIYALGIRHIGEKASRQIAGEIASIDELIKLEQDSLKTLPDFGPIMIESIVNWLNRSQNRESLTKLKEAGVNPAPLEQSASSPFSGNSIVLTGSLSESRTIWKSRLERAGFNVASSVSQKTNYLLAGEKAGSKLKKAEELGVTIISEEEISQMLEESQS